MRRHAISVLVAIAALLAVLALYPQRTGEVRVSEFGRYQGYSEAAYDGNRRTSDYLALPNGTRLAYDLILPTRKGAPAAEALPVLFKYTPYLRTFTIFDRDGNNLIADLFEMPWWQRAYLRVRYWTSDRGHLLDPLFRTRWLERMVRHGYAVIVVERSGTGASSGVADLSHAAAAREASDILDWIAAQPWSDGRIGMYGESFQAMVQFAAASSGNPHLKAIFPASSSFDAYHLTFSGGVYNKGFQSFFTWAMTFLERVVTPVDGDKDGALLAKVIAERRGRTAGEQSVRFKDYPFRDSVTPKGQRFWEAGSVHALIERVNRANVPAYLTVGWLDIMTGDAFLLHRNLTVPRRLMVRPIDHSAADESGSDLDYAAEAHRWFDYWLKGIDNGIMREPPIHYYVMGAPKEQAWRASRTWPPANMTAKRFYLGEASLAPEPPAAAVVADAGTVDYSATTGTKSRWRAINWPHEYPDMRANDAKGLTYTTARLAMDTEIVGHAVLHLWLSADAPDADVFAYLEEVDSDGKSTYVTEGNLRASHRKPGRAPYDNLGLPWHPHGAKDVEPMPGGEPAELVFSLQPTAHRFAKGKRIRLTVTFADTDNYETPVLDPPPRVRVHRGGQHASVVELPLGR
jgi:putative CocE/NonD family hydrolase